MAEDTTGNGGTEGVRNLPAWLFENAPQPASRKRRPFFERTLAEVVRFMDDTLFNESVSMRNGFLQKVNPRTKITAIAALIIALSFQKTPAQMLPFVIFVLILAAASLIPPVTFLKRLLPPLLLTSVIALPATLNIVTKGQNAFPLFGGVYATRQGLLSAEGLVLRAVGSIMLVFLVSFTTTPVRLIKAVGSLTPGGFRLMIETGYRYIFFFARKLEEFVFAMKARFSYGISGAEGRRWAGSRAASLLLIGAGLKDELKMAMEARGISYEYPKTAMKNFSGPAWGFADIIFVLLCAAFIFLEYRTF